MYIFSGPVPGFLSAPRVTTVAVRLAVYVEQVIFCFDDGTQTVWGHTGGNKPVTWDIKSNDHIVTINVRQGLALDGIQFVTFQGKVSPWYGGNGGSPAEFSVQYGCEIVGLLLKRSDYSEYSFATGTVSGICSRTVGGLLPPMFLLVKGSIVQLDPKSSPYNGYTYEGHSDVKVNVVVYRSDLIDAIKRDDIEPEVKSAIIKILDFPGAQFIGSMVIGKLMEKAIVPISQVTNNTIPQGLMHYLQAPGNGMVSGLQGYVREYLQQNSQIMGNLSGVVLAHIAAPIYAANGNGEEAVKIAAGAMIGLSAAIVGGIPALAVGLVAAPLLISGVFYAFGESATELAKRWKNDALVLYQKVSEPLSKKLSSRSSVRCPNRHVLVDNGPPTLPFLADLPPFRHRCCGGISRQCTRGEERWQFRTIRFYCTYCALCYCEPCMLEHVQENRALPPRVTWH